MSKVRQLQSAYACPPALLAGHNNDLVVEQNFRFEIVLGEVGWYASEQKINAAVTQFAEMQGADDGLDYIESNARIESREAFDDRRKKSGGDTFRTANTELARGRIGQELQFLHPLLELIEDRRAAPHQRVAVGSRLNAIAASVEQPNAERVLHVGYRL